MKEGIPTRQYMIDQCPQKCSVSLSPHGIDSPELESAESSPNFARTVRLSRRSALSRVIDKSSIIDSKHGCNFMRQKYFIFCAPQWTRIDIESQYATNNEPHSSARVDGKSSIGVFYKRLRTRGIITIMLSAHYRSIEFYLLQHSGISMLDGRENYVEGLTLLRNSRKHKNFARNELLWAGIDFREIIFFMNVMMIDIPKKSISNEKIPRLIFNRLSKIETNCLRLR